jgi:hypothetical protein
MTAKPRLSQWGLTRKLPRPDDSAALKKELNSSRAPRRIWDNATMNLDESQRKRVEEWISQGLKLSEIQNRLASELGLTLTYMDVRLLVDDLKLTPKDVEPAKPTSTVLAGGGDKTATPAAPQPASSAEKSEPPAATSGGVSVSVDQLARPGAVVSGKVTFSDGNRAEWYLDQSGRLGLVPQQPGYRPPASDLQQFQMALETELSRMGF